MASRTVVINAKSFGERLKHKRMQHAKQQTELAEFLGITKALISALERGVQTPGINTIMGIQRFFAELGDFMILDWWCFGDQIDISFKKEEAKRIRDLERQVSDLKEKLKLSMDNNNTLKMLVDTMKSLPSQKSSA